MDIHLKKRRADLFDGSLMYSIGNCKNAFRYLEETNKLLNEVYQIGPTTNLNELGHKDRVFKDYLILKIASLFDKNSKTLSLYTLDKFLKNEIPTKSKDFSIGFKLILSAYGKHIDQIVATRHNVVAHSGEDGLDNFMHTADLLSMPIPELLSEIEKLVAEAHITTFPVADYP